jgi:hypothetical protein
MSKGTIITQNQLLFSKFRNRIYILIQINIRFSDNFCLFDNFKRKINSILYFVQVCTEGPLGL